MNRPAPSARSTAADAYLRVIKNRQTIETALDSVPGYENLEDRDRGFARAIIAACFRRHGQTEAALAAFLSKPLEETAPYARALLITGAAQLLWLETPAHAAVSEAVNLAAARPETRKLKGLINAVLRKVAAEGPQIAKTIPPQDNLPDWLRQSWRKAYGPGKLGRIASALTQIPPLDLTMRDPDSAQAWAKTLGGDCMPNGTVRLKETGGITALEGFDDGAWWVQDAAASMPAKLLDISKDSRVFDLCAAPGGKTLQLAARSDHVTAVDLSEKRLKRVRENLQRTGLSAEVVAADVRKWTPDAPADAILLDAPCTATGTLRRHPESSWIKQKSDVGKMAGIQMELAKAALNMLRPGGQLLVCTCSLQPEEGELLAAKLVAAHNSLRVDPIRPDEAPGMADAITAEGYLRLTPALWPETGGMDGFFIARFSKAG